MRSLTVAAAAILLAGCIGGQRSVEPPRPNRSLTPEVVAVATEFKWGRCASTLVTLESGQVVPVKDANMRDPACTEPTPAPSRFLFGKADDARSFLQGEGVHTTEGSVWESGHGPLLFVGTDEDGTWLAVARWNPRNDWCVTFEGDNGAYLEGDNLHTVKGVVVPLAPAFEWPIEPDLVFPLRSSDEACFDSEGEVIRVRPFLPY
jgi:hypothetical protein